MEPVIHRMDRSRMPTCQSNLSLTEWNDVAPELPYERTFPNLPPGTGAPADAKAANYER